MIILKADILFCRFILLFKRLLISLGVLFVCFNKKWIAGPFTIIFLNRLSIYGL